MVSDDEKEPGAVKRAAKRLFPAYFSLLLLLSGLWLAVTFLGDPHAGEPALSLDLTPPAVAHEKAADVHGHGAPPGTEGHDGGHDADAAAGGAEAEGGTATPANGNANGNADGNASSGLTETVPEGTLPRIAADGTTPMRAYAGAMPKTPGARIAIVVGGLGVSKKVTDSALSLLPTGVTLAFSPYGDDLSPSVSRARQMGHEVLIEIPMEPYDYPDNDPGPYTLRASASSIFNFRRLIWVLTRISGYTGATNAQGARLLGDADSLEPVFSFMAKRGLLFFESAPPANSAGARVAAQSGIAFAQADKVLDASLDSADIDRALVALEALAKRHGRASASAQAYPIVIERINAWAQSLDGKGVVIVPLSAVVSEEKPSKK